MILTPPTSLAEGDHNGYLSHFFYWLLSCLGVPDHKGGVVLLITGTLLSIPLRSSQRILAVDIGGQRTPLYFTHSLSLHYSPLPSFSNPPPSLSPSNPPSFLFLIPSLSLFHSLPLSLSSIPSLSLPFPLSLTPLSFSYRC